MLNTELPESHIISLCISVLRAYWICRGCLEGRVKPYRVVRGSGQQRAAGQGQGNRLRRLLGAALLALLEAADAGVGHARSAARLGWHSSRKWPLMEVRDHCGGG